MKTLNNIFFNLNSQLKINYSLVLIVITIATIFLRYVPDLSFKIIYFVQALLLFIIYIKNFSIDKKIIFYFLPVVIYPLFSSEIKYFAIILLLILLNLLFNKPEREDFKFNNNIFYLFYFSLIFLAKSVNNDQYFLSIILNSTINLSLATTRYSYFNLDPNYASILILMIFNIFFYQMNKNYLKRFTIFSFLLILLTQSKSGIIFYLIVIIFYFFKIEFKKKILIFLLVNFILFLASIIFYNNFSNPYIKKNYSIPSKQSTTSVVDVYYSEICFNKKFNKVKYLTDCRDLQQHSKKNYIINKLLGVSVYLKLYSIGFSVNDIIFNLNDYFFPDGVKNRSNTKINSKYVYSNQFSAHNILIKGIQNFGLIYFLIFLINCYLFFKKSFNYNFFPVIFSCIFIGLDIFLFLPILALSFKKEATNI